MIEVEIVIGTESEIETEIGTETGIENEIEKEIVRRIATVTEMTPVELLQQLRVQTHYLLLL